MRNNFNDDDYLDYLLERCNDVAGGPVDRVGGAAQIARHLEWLELTPASEVLEIGCGTGRVMEIARLRFGTMMYGCDISRPAIEYIRRERPHFAERTFVLDDQGTSVLGSEWADAIVFWGCFELVPQRASLLEALRILRPGGRLLLSSLKHHRPFPDDADARQALEAYREKKIPISVSDPVAFERFVHALGLSIERRIVFERKSDLVEDKFSMDEGGERTFSEAIYVLRKTAQSDLALSFSTYFGAEERISSR